MSHIALSYSRLSTYEKCPFKFHSQYIDKNYPDEGENFHFVKGKKKHSQLENYIKCKNDPTMMPMMCDGDVLNAIPIIDQLIGEGYEVTAEHQLAVDVNWNPITWFSKESMFRAICDAICIKGDEAILLDWKTGKFRDYDGTPTGQLHLAAAVVFAHRPEISTIKTAYLYIEHRQKVMRQFTRDMFETDLCDPFNEAFATVNADKEFSANRNQYCNWCLLNKKNEGLCPIGL